MFRVISGWGDAGGIVGANSGLVEYSYFSGSVLSESFVGGIAGSNAGILRTNYASGSIFGRWGLGGIMGENGTSFFSNAHAENCFFDVQATGRMGGSPRGEKDGTMIGMIPSDVGWMDRQNFEESKWFITVNTYPQLRIMAESDNDDLRSISGLDANNYDSFLYYKSKEALSVDEVPNTPGRSRRHVRARRAGCCGQKKPRITFWSTRRICKSIKFF